VSVRDAPHAAPVGGAADDSKCADI